jgi:hypothetical protein
MDAFADILNKPSGEAPKPQALPSGTYLTVVDGPYRANKVGADQTDVVDFQLKILQVMEANQDEITAVPDGVPGKTIFARFFITEKALYRLDDFLERLGIEKGLPYKEALGQCPGKSVVVNLGQRPSPDSSRMFNEIKSYAKA